MNHPLVDAFVEAHDGWSADRVIADPQINGKFIRACREHGLVDPTAELNLDLLSKRKRRGVLPPTTRPTTIRGQDEYAFASEIAIRSLERKHGTTLDRVLCDPELAQEFDYVASAIAPGFTPLEYRWTALGLRKTRKLRPEILGRVVPSEVIGPALVAPLDVSAIPKQQGIYVLSTREKVLYVGEAKSLQNRIKRHLDHSDNKQLARYIWAFGRDDLFIEYHVLPEHTRTDVRKAMELELIRSRRAEFNVQR